MKRNEISWCKAILYGLLIGDMLFVGCAEDAKNAKLAVEQRPTELMVRHVPDGYQPDQWEQIRTTFDALIDSPEKLSKQGVLGDLFPLDGTVREKIEEIQVIPDNLKIPNDFDAQFTTKWADAFAEPGVKECVAELQKLDKVKWERVANLNRGQVADLLGDLDEQLSDKAVWEDPNGDWQHNVEVFIASLTAKKGSSTQDARVIEAAVKAAEAWRDQAKKTCEASEELVKATRSLRTSALNLLRTPPTDEIFKVNITNNVQEFKTTVGNLVDGGQYRTVATELALLKARKKQLDESLQKAGFPLSVRQGMGEAVVTTCGDCGDGAGWGQSFPLFSGALYGMLAFQNETEGQADESAKTEDGNKDHVNDNQRHAAEYAINALAAVLITIGTTYVICSICGVAIAGWFVVVVVVIVILIALIYWSYLERGDRNSSGDGPKGDVGEADSSKLGDMQAIDQAPPQNSPSEGEGQSGEKGALEPEAGSQSDPNANPTPPSPQPEQPVRPEGAKPFEIQTSEEFENGHAKVDDAYEFEGEVIFRFTLDDKETIEARVPETNEKVFPVLEEGELSAVTKADKEGHYWLHFVVKGTDTSQDEEIVRLEVFPSGEVSR